jgi:hypothetical protein
MCCSGEDRRYGEREACEAVMLVPSVAAAKKGALRQ